MALPGPLLRSPDPAQRPSEDLLHIDYGCDSSILPIAFRAVYPCQFRVPAHPDRPPDLETVLFLEGRDQIALLVSFASPASDPRARVVAKMKVGLICADERLRIELEGLLNIGQSLAPVQRGQETAANGVGRCFSRSVSRAPQRHTLYCSNT